MSIKVKQFGDLYKITIDASRTDYIFILVYLLKINDSLLHIKFYMTPQ